MTLANKSASASNKFLAIVAGFFVVAIATTAALAQSPQYDLLLKGGHVIDPANKLDAAVEEWVGAILSAGPNAIRAQKELMHDWERMSIADAIQQGIRAVAAAHGSEETRRLMGAFVAKRQQKREAKP